MHLTLLFHVWLPHVNEKYMCVCAYVCEENELYNNTVFLELNNTVHNNKSMIIGVKQKQRASDWIKFVEAVVGSLLQIG